MMLKINDKRLAAITLVICAAIMSPQCLAGGATASVLRFQQKMADKGQPYAQYKLAMMYESGSGVEKNLLQAKVWYGRAALQDFKPARHRLTYLDIKQNGYHEQHAAWVKDLKRDAVYGDGEALFLLGQMYADGVGLEKNLPKSLELLRKAAAGNIAGSETELVRVESMYLAEKQQAEKQRLLKAAEQKQVEQEAQRKEIQEQQRLRRLEQQRQERERQLIAERQHQLELARKRQAEETRAQQLAAKRRALEAAMENPVLVTDTSSNTICSGRNRFSATCR